MDEEATNNALAQQQKFLRQQQQFLLLHQFQQQQQQQQQHNQQQQQKQQIQQQQQQQQIQQQQQQQIQQQQQKQQIQQQQQQQIQQQRQKQQIQQQQQQIQQQQQQHLQQQHQQLLQQKQQQPASHHLQQQLQIYQQQQHLQQLQQRQQQAISRFPSNIDAHLRPQGIRSLQLQQQQQQQQQQQNQNQSQQQPQQKGVGGGGGVGVVGVGVGRQGNQIEIEMAQQDAWKVCNPDTKSPFSSLEDAVQRLLPYHVVADFEAEEDDRMVESDPTGQVQSRLQQWDHTILAKLAEFTSTFEKQVLAFNIMSRKRALGEFRSEERLMIEQALLQEEKQTILQLRAEAESREKADREAAEARTRMAMVQAEQVRASAHSEMLNRAPLRGIEGPGHELGHDQVGNVDEVNHGWGNNLQREEEEPSDDYLNDENEPEPGDTGLQGEWRGSGELDLNAR